MMTLDVRRRFFAEELEAVCRFKTPALVDAFARVERENFLPPGPWTIAAESDVAFSMTRGAPRYRTTPDADPARVYHNIAVAIDPERQLFNGQPATLGHWIDTLDLARGARVLHVGAGTGYYTAVMGECVGPDGRVLAFEADEALAANARANLSSRAWIDTRHGDASAPLAETFDVILVNAGVTHPLGTWLDALAAGGRMILPITVDMPAMGSTLGKGIVVLVTRGAAGEFAARVVTVVAVYSAIGIRDPVMTERIGKALTAGPMAWQAVRALRRDAHEPSPSCWLHGPTACFSTVPQ
jgi:protein-L-isoaspartate(D-aspartate) O-methyltransferase